MWKIGELKDGDEEKKGTVSSLKQRILSDFNSVIKEIGVHDFSNEEIKEILSAVDEWTDDRIACLMMYRIPFEIVLDKALEVPTLRFILLRRMDFNSKDKEQTLKYLTSNDEIMKLYFRLLKNTKNDSYSNVFLLELTNSIIDEQRKGEKITYVISKAAVKRVVTSSYIMSNSFNEDEIIRIIEKCVYPEEREAVKSEFFRVLAEVRKELKQIGLQEPSEQDPSKDTVSGEVSSVPVSDYWAQE